MVFIGFLLGAYYNVLVYLTPYKVSIGYKKELIDLRILQQVGGIFIIQSFSSI